MKLTLSEISQAMATNDKGGGDLSFYGVVSSKITENGKVTGYNITVGDSVIEARKLAGADVGDVVLCTTLNNGMTVVTGRLNGDGDVEEAVTKAEEADEKATSIVERADNGEFDGIGVASSTVTYQVSSSATSVPSGTWDSQPQATANGEYLWTRTIITYTDNSTTTIYSIAAHGDKGNTPVITASKSGKVTTISADGTSIATVVDGSDGSSPTVNKVGDTVYITDVSGNTVSVSDGADGQSIKGDDGDDAYLHIAWANSSDGTTDFSTTVSTGKQYMGTYTDHTQADSSTPSSYSWVKIKGEDGDDGHSPTITASKSGSTTTVQVDGTTVATINDGTNGTSYYTYVRYSANSDGSGMVTTPTTSTKYIGLYTGTSSTCPAYTSFTWSKYQGEDGTNGTNGTNGNDGASVTEVKILYYLKSNTTAPSAPTAEVTSTSTSSGVWTTAVPTYVSGYSYFTCAQSKYSSGTSPRWTTPVLDNALTNANSNASSALSTAQSTQTIIREYSGGVLVGKTGNTIGSLVNANGSFDVVNTTWNGTTPTAGTALATFGTSARIGASNNFNIEVTSSEVKYNKNGTTHATTAWEEKSGYLPTFITQCPITNATNTNYTSRNYYYIDHISGVGIGSERYDTEGVSRAQLHLTTTIGSGTGTDSFQLNTSKNGSAGVTLLGSSDGTNGKLTVTTSGSSAGIYSNNPIYVGGYKLIGRSSVETAYVTVAKSSYSSGNTVSVGTKTGYTAVGIIGYDIHNDSSGSNSSYCVLYDCHLSGTNVSYSIRNTNSSNQAKVKITFYILWVASSQGIA